MTESNIISHTIKLLKCDTARIVSPCGKHFMIIGYFRHTKDNKGSQWLKNGKSFDFYYDHNEVIASGKTLRSLWRNVKYYSKLP